MAVDKVFIGMDISLTKVGISVYNAGNVTTGVIGTGGHGTNHLSKTLYLWEKLENFLNNLGVYSGEIFLVTEQHAISFGGNKFKSRSVYDNGYADGAICVNLIKLFDNNNTISYINMHLKTLKKFATGNGNAKKVDMITEFERVYSLEAANFANNSNFIFDTLVFPNVNNKNGMGDVADSFFLMLGGMLVWCRMNNYNSVLFSKTVRDTLNIPDFYRIEQ